MKTSKPAAFAYSLAWVWIGLFLIAAGAAMGDSCIEWRSVLPAGRSFHGMAYDSARHVTVVFGGTSQSSFTPLADTWEYDGWRWDRRATTGPQARWSHAMAYDSARRVTVLFGGVALFSNFGDTWEWDGAAWTLRSLIGPPSQGGHAMAFDAGRRVAVMFGKEGQTWEWDGGAWALRATTGPAPRAGHSMVYDAVRGRVLLFGGTVGGGETWEWDGRAGAWSLLATSGPPARFGAAMAYDLSRGAADLFGGYLGATPNPMLDDTWEWDSRSGAWNLIAASGSPSKRAMMRMVYDEELHRMFMFGGQPDAIRNEWWSYNPVAAQWILSGTQPLSLQAPQMAYDAGRQVSVVLAMPTSAVQTWEWDGIAWLRRNIIGPPKAAPLVYDIERGVTTLFIGIGANAGQTWTYDGVKWTLAAEDGPARSGHALAYDSARRVVVLFGGALDGGGTELADTWEWDGKTWTLRAEAGPPPRWSHSMAYDSFRQRTVMCGGRRRLPAGGWINYTDTWEWDGDQWRQASDSGFTDSVNRQMVYDATWRECLLDRSILSIWNGLSWTTLDDFSPATIGTAAMAYDVDSKVTVKFGGDPWAREIWELAYHGPCGGDVNGDGTVDAADLMEVVNAWT